MTGELLAQALEGGTGLGRFAGPSLLVERARQRQRRREEPRLDAQRLAERCYPLVGPSEGQEQCAQLGVRPGVLSSRGDRLLVLGDGPLHLRFAGDEIEAGPRMEL